MDDLQQPPSPAAARKRLYRQRRRQGLICVSILLHEGQIGTLIAQGRLPEHKRSDPSALATALNAILADILTPKTALLMELRSQTGRVPKAR